MDLEAPSHDDKNISQDETANSVQVLAKDMPYEPPTYSKTSPGKRKNLFLAILALVIIAALVVGLSVGLTNKNDEDTKRGSALDEDTEDSAGAVSTPTLAPSVSQGPTAEPKRFPDVVNFLVQQGISSETDLMTDGTPQNRAARWIADEDLHLASFGDDDYQVGVINQAFQFVARYALAVFAFSTNGPNGWTQPLYFLSGRPVCGWYDTNFLGQRVGVSCDDQWLRPERLVMDYVGLRGPIPAELAKIWTIRTIDMENNFLNGTLPEGLGNLPLTFFVLKGNSISGPLPSNLGQNGLMEVMVSTHCWHFTSTHHLLGSSVPPPAPQVMSNNQMTGPIPTSLSMSTNLRSLGEWNEYLSCIPIQYNG